MIKQILGRNRLLEYIGFVSILISATSAGCPSKCICSMNTVICAQKFLLDVPNFETLENNPITIDLSENDIDYIDHYALSFDKAEIVEILYLNDSKIIDIDDTAFKELTSLREIYLSNNLLNDLPPNSFKFNDKLEHLDLSFNLFLKMPKIKSHSLSILNLMNSGIETIENDRFVDLPNLNFLFLQRNNIRIIDLEMFKFLPNLILVRLEYNAWKCTCESVKMFNYLIENNQTIIDEQIQCRSENDFFITIFDENGIVNVINDTCTQNINSFHNFGGEYNEVHDVSTLSKPPRKINRKIKSDSSLNKTSLATACQNIEFVKSSSWITYATFTSAILISFIIGLIFGTQLSSKKENTSSSSSFLLSIRNDEN